MKSFQAFSERPNWKNTYLIVISYNQDPNEKEYCVKQTLSFISKTVPLLSVHVPTFCATQGPPFQGLLCSI